MNDFKIISYQDGRYELFHINMATTKTKFPCIGVSPFVKSLHCWSLLVDSGAVEEMMMKIDANLALGVYCPPYREIRHVHTDLESVEDMHTQWFRQIHFIHRRRICIPT